MPANAFDYQKMLMEQRDKCSEIMRRDSEALKREMESGVKSFHDALSAHREEEKEERREDRKTVEHAIGEMKETLKPLVKTVADSDARSKSNKYRLNWLYGILAVVIAAAIVKAFL